VKAVVAVVAKAAGTAAVAEIEVGAVVDTTNPPGK
jgi:hypothetical protein